MKLETIVELVKQHFVSAQAVSLLTMYCQKFGISMPKWDFTVNAATGSIPATFNLKLEIQNQVFETRKAANKNDAKRACSKVAVRYFVEAGIEFFQNFEPSYSSLMTTLAQMAGLDPPVFRITGNNPFTIDCTFNSQEYFANRPFSSKSVAKDEICRIVYNSIKTDQKLYESIYLNNPALLSTNCDELEVRHYKKCKTRIDLAEESMMSSLDEIANETENAPVVSNLNFVDQLYKYYEQYPTIGKPFYNSRTISNELGLSYKSQLIVGVHSAISNLHRTRFEADNEVAKTILQQISPDILNNDSRDYKKRARSSSESNTTIPASHRTKMDQPEPIYYSDDERNPSYEHLLYKFLDSKNMKRPMYTYENVGHGFTCQATLEFQHGHPQTLKSLRSHSKRETAREDVCHDIYVVLTSQLPSN